MPTGTREEGGTGVTGHWTGGEEEEARSQEGGWLGCSAAAVMEPASEREGRGQQSARAAEPQTAEGAGAAAVRGRAGSPRASDADLS